MDLASARQAILDALAPVAAGSLAGRVYPYPPTVGRQSGPAIWIEQPTLTRSTIGNNTAVVVASFDVWIVADGADEAQVSALDDAVAQVWAAMTAAHVSGAVNTRPVDVLADTVETPDGRGGTVRRRAAVVTVEVTVAAASFCPPPTPDPVQIPPTLVSASVEE